MRKYINLIGCVTLFVSLILSGCSDAPEQKSYEHEQPEINFGEAVPLTGEGIDGTDPFITVDQNGQPVICWTEQIDSGVYVVKFAQSDDFGKTFGQPIEVSTSIGTNSHAEGMNKIAFKSDGSILVIFGLSKPLPNKPHAGELWCTMLRPGAQEWSEPRPLHNDTTPGSGHSFFDMARLPNGEIGCCWLDAAKSRRGRPVHYAMTSPGKMFSDEVVLDSIACQCCRTEIMVDGQNNINVAYRDIINDSIRDMVVLVSRDGGLSFEPPVRISEDNWKVNGCPHTGPTLASINGGVRAYWFTEGGGTGVYTSQVAEGQKSFDKRVLLSEDARHPQAASLGEGTIAITWNEFVETDAGSSDRVYVQVSMPNGETRQACLSTVGKNAKFPVILGVGDQFLVCWREDQGSTSRLFYSIASVRGAVL